MPIFHVPKGKHSKRMSKIKQRLNAILFGIMFLTYCLKRDIQEWWRQLDDEKP